METRKIQSIGGSSFSLTLPKNWIKLQKLKNKDEINIYQQQSGQLLIQAKGDGHIHIHKISIEGLEGDELYRETLVLYILGFDNIELHAKSISREQRAVVRRAAQSLIGMETIDESSSSIYLRSFLDPKKFSFQEYVSKSFLMTRLMFADSIASFLKHNKDLAADVDERDFEIDKIDFFISRMKRSLMLNRISEEEINSSLVDADYYEYIIKGLERIADHAVKIAKLTEVESAPTSEKLEKLIVTGSEKIIDLLKQAESFTLDINKKLANAVLNKIQNLPPHHNTVYQELAKGGYAPALVLHDSLDRTTGYIRNMAEATLAQAMIKEYKH